MRTNLLLAASLAVIAAYAWLVPEPEQEVGFKVVAGRISHVSVRERGDTRFRLKRHGEAWMLTEPVALPADPFQVNALLEGLRQPATRRYRVEEADLAELGLESPAWSVEVNGETLHLGGRSALGGQRYVRKGEHIFLVSDVLSYRLQREPLDYASKRLLPESKVLAVIRLPSGERVKRSGVGWALEPEREGMTADALQGMADAWRNATATEISPANSVPRAGDVVVEFADGSELRFGVEMTETALKLTRAEPAVTYTMPPGAAQEMLQLQAVSPNEATE